MKFSLFCEAFTVWRLLDPEEDSRTFPWRCLRRGRRYSSVQDISHAVSSRQTPKGNIKKIALACECKHAGMYRIYEGHDELFSAKLEDIECLLV